MNHLEVQLIGVFDCTPPMENFCYSVDLPAPWNLWVSARCTDGTSMHPLFMGYVLNELIDADAWNEGDTTVVTDQDDHSLRAVVGGLADKEAEGIEAYQSRTGQVRIVTVEPWQ